VNLRRDLLVLALGAVIGLGACGDDDDEPADSGATDTAAEQSEPAPADVDTSKKPKVTVPEGEPPAGLQIEDLKEGDGPTAKAGDNVNVHYVGVSYSTGTQFDASWDTPGAQPFTFPLGQGQVIPGWDQGVAGMKVGGRRQLTIPPELGYGEAGAPPDIAPNETLIFVVDLLEIG
jgi:peptidylprolyl isomerase